MRSDLFICKWKCNFISSAESIFKGAYCDRKNWKTFHFIRFIFVMSSVRVWVFCCSIWKRKLSIPFGMAHAYYYIKKWNRNQSLFSCRLTRLVCLWIYHSIVPKIEKVFFNGIVLRLLRMLLKRNIRWENPRIKLFSICSIPHWETARGEQKVGFKFRNKWECIHMKSYVDFRF